MACAAMREAIASDEARLRAAMCSTLEEKLVEPLGEHVGVAAHFGDGRCEQAGTRLFDAASEFAYRLRSGEPLSPREAMTSIDAIRGLWDRWIDTDPWRDCYRQEAATYAAAAKRAADNRAAASRPRRGRADPGLKRSDALQAVDVATPAMVAQFMREMLASADTAYNVPKRRIAAICAKFRISERTAHRRIQAARAAGLLP